VRDGTGALINFSLATLSSLPRVLHKWNKFLAVSARKYYNALRHCFCFSMRSNISLFVLITLLAGCAFEGVIVQKKSRLIPETSIPDIEDTHAFVFRGPTGTSRPPIMMPAPEFTGSEMNSICTFILRDRQGNLHSQMVTPPVFARYQVGDYFNDCQPGPQVEAKDSKAMVEAPAIQRRHSRHRAHRTASSHRAHRKFARHHRHHPQKKQNAIAAG
jgi:hypothetical protein